MTDELISSESDKSRDERLDAEIDREMRAASGLVHCAHCDSEVAEDRLERCRCGVHGCRNCFYPVQTESFADEYVCSVRCEKESLEQALNQISSQRTADMREVVLKYDRITTAIARRIDAINRTEIREEAALTLMQLNCVRQTYPEATEAGKILANAMALIRKLSK
jgi:hypothetical protein